MHIPVININGDVVTGFNNVTQKLFANKIDKIYILFSGNGGRGRKVCI